MCGADVHAVNKNGDTPLHEANTHGMVKVVQYLAGEGAANVIAVNGDGRTPLHIACGKGCRKSVVYDLACNASAQVLRFNREKVLGRSFNVSFTM
jgi:ankyrin repeat protein